MIVVSYRGSFIVYERRTDHMSEKRRDNKNRVLRNGESQRSDGRYAYKYIDSNGKQQFIYSWKLDKNDKLPPGKRQDISLREKEKRLQKDIEDNIAFRGVVRPAFQMAVDDDLIRKNPFEFQLATVVVNDSVTRGAITRKQERKFLEFVRNDNHYCRYYDGMFILFKTGLRISEFCGLTVSDIDLKGRKINVDHQLQRTRDMTYMIEDTKTTSGTRQVPMTDEVADAFKRAIANRKHCNILWDILILA